MTLDLQLVTLAVIGIGAGMIRLYLQEITEALREFRGKFRGGRPRLPSHPLPAADGVFSGGDAQAASTMVSRKPGAGDLQCPT
jgi:hypothetical protein